MRRFNLFTLALRLALSLSVCAQWAAVAQGVFIDPVLSVDLANRGPSDQVQAVVNFDSTVTSSAYVDILVRHILAGPTGCAISHQPSAISH